MQKKANKTNIAISKAPKKQHDASVANKIHRLMNFVIIFLLLVSLPFSTSPSFGKYVLDPIIDTTSFQSAETYTVTSIGAITGTTQIGNTLTAGSLSPAGATVDYQWQKSSVSGGIYTDIAGATSRTYTLKEEDKGFYIKVVATGKNNYTGIVISPYTGSVTATPITDIGVISGTGQVGKTLTAGSLSPAGTTVTYQWLKAGDADGPYETITGATSKNYKLTAAELNSYIKVQATGTGAYTGTVTSAYKGPMAAGQITAIGPIAGTTSINQTLTAGNLTPYGATVNYQWQRSNGTYSFTNIVGATSSSYTLKGADGDCYIRVVVTGTGAYTGTVTSDYVGRVGYSIIALTSIGTISGTAQVGQVLTAGTLSPTGATATYQWQRCITANGTYEIITGATGKDYTLTTADKDKYIRVAAIGSSNFTGTVTSASKGPVVAGQLNAMGPISGTTAIGETLMAGTLTPVSATVTYQWQKCDTTNGTYVNIPNANASTYTLTDEDVGYYIKVVATGTGAFSGTVTSAYTGPVSLTTTPITSIGTISGAPQVTQTLTAGTLSPSGATVTYQWLRADAADGTYENIPGATSNIYVLSTDDINYYIKVQAAGAGTYTGTVTSAYKGPVVTGQITAIGPISGTTLAGQTLTVGTLTPYGATATYQWQRSNGTDSFIDIVGGTSSSYILTGNDSYCYIRVVATGIGGYTGTVISDYVGRVGPPITALTSIGVISGTAEIGQVLTAGTLAPAGTATYQWQRCATDNGTYENIPGATAKDYTLTAADKDKYIKVEATGSDSYSGTVISTSKGPVAAGQLTAMGTISGTTAIGETLTAGTLKPASATVTYQWQKCDTTNGTYTNIVNANASTYTLTASDEGYYIKVVVTGTGDYTGTVTSAYTGPVSLTTTPIISIGIISGTAAIGQTLTAGNLSPAGATTTYQWLRCITEDGTYENIPGATSNTYTLSANELNHYIKVQAAGSGTCSGTVISAGKGPVAAAQLAAIGTISGTTSVDQTLTVGTLTPYGATATYQWQRSNGTDPFTDIVGGTASSYTLTGPDSYCYIRVVATGNGAYTGTAISDYVGRVGNSITTLTSIGAIKGTAEVGELLTAGNLTPAGTATYQWQRCVTADGTYENIPGATSKTYMLTSTDKNKYIKVVAAGSSTYSGSVTSAGKGPVGAGQLTAIGLISGTTAVGQTLTAGTLTPVSATVTYQWQKCDSTNGSYTDIINANASTYTLTAIDEGYYIKVVATAMGAYSGIATSAYSGPVGATTTTITSIGTISGTAQVGKILIAGTLSPAGAIVTYQWQRCDTNVGIYENIPGATSNTYTLSAEDLNHYIRVQAIGAGAYSGTVTSACKGTVAPGQLAGIGPISGTTALELTLTVGNLTPYGATATYQWQRSYGTDPFIDIVGGTSSTYTLTGSDSYCYIRVVATGTGAYTGTAISDNVGRVGILTTALTSIGAINGISEVGQILTAGTLTPAGTATYQWQRCATFNGTYEEIVGATGKTYTLTAADKDKYIKVVAIGSSTYTGTVTSASKGPVAAGKLTAIGPIGGTTAVGQTLTAGTLAPVSATVTYQWQKCDTTNGSYTDIINANASNYTLTSEDVGYYIIVVAKGTGVYTGTATSDYTGPVGVTTTPITSIGTISGIAQAGKILTAGILSPGGATATYQWLRCATEEGTYEDIPGATSNAYTLTVDDMDCYIKVQATGSGTYTGIVTSSCVGTVMACQITGISNIIGTTIVGQTLTAGTLTPYDATATYQWQYAGKAGGNYTNIGGATANTYSLSSADNGRYLKVVATGTGAYKGTVTSNYAGPVSYSPIPLTSMGAINGSATVGEILTAGTLSPSGATATYQWQSCAASNGDYVNITGANSNTYVISVSDTDKYLRVIAAGSGRYSGTMTSTYVGPVASGMMMMVALMEETAPITAIGEINGRAQVGRTLEAGALSPSDAEVTYQWQRCATEEGTYENISGATSSTYTLTDGDETYYIRVVATSISSDTASEEGTDTVSVTSTAIGPVEARTPITAIGTINGRAQVGRTLEAGALSPSDAEVTYQWQRCAIADGTYENIGGATSSTYILTDSDETYYIQVVATGTGAYIGTETSIATGSVEARTPITAIGSVSGITQVDQTLEAGTLNPSDATATYQWQRCDTADGSFTDISGATSSTYTLTASDDYNCYIRVTATGTDGYTGTVISEPTAQIGAATISIDEIIGIEVPEEGKTPDDTVDDTAQYTAAISWSPGDSEFIGGEIYTATIVITSKTGYTTEGLTADFFLVEGAESVTNSESSGVVTVVFLATVHDPIEEEIAETGNVVGDGETDKTGADSGTEETEKNSETGGIGEIGNTTGSVGTGEIGNTTGSVGTGETSGDDGTGSAAGDGESETGAGTGAEETE